MRFGDVLSVHQDGEKVIVKAKIEPNATTETTGVEPISIAANVPYSLSLQTSWSTFVEYTSTEFPIHQLNFQFIN